MTERIVIRRDQNEMEIRVISFGGLRVLEDGRELQRILSQRSRAALFVYLTIERRVSRDALTAMFWPESDAENARHALRQSLYHIRNALGAVDWIESRPHELLVHRVAGTDAAEFSDAIERGDSAHAVQLYRGPFLDAVHLVDLQAWECWVDARRTRYARQFRKASRDLLDTKVSDRDFDGAIAIAERWTALDPTDDEAQHRLIATLAAAGERTDAIRQYETYARLLAPDGLEPLDETRELINRLADDRVRPTHRTRPSALRRRPRHRPARETESGT